MPGPGGRRSDPQPIRTRTADLEHLTVVASRDHAGPVVEAFLKRLAGAEITSMGSSLKFCLVAEGKADFYPRVVPTFQWDTAAAQAILEAAGGHLTELDGSDWPIAKTDCATRRSWPLVTTVSTGPRSSTPSSLRLRRAPPQSTIWLASGRATR